MLSAVKRYQALLTSTLARYFPRTTEYMRAEREKRALIAKSEGERQQEINIADGKKQAAVLESEGEKAAAINRAQGEATALRLIADGKADDYLWDGWDADTETTFLMQ